MNLLEQIQLLLSCVSEISCGEREMKSRTTTQPALLFGVSCWIAYHPCMVSWCILSQSLSSRVTKRQLLSQCEGIRKCDNISLEISHSVFNSGVVLLSASPATARKRPLHSAVREDFTYIRTFRLTGEKGHLGCARIYCSLSLQEESPVQRTCERTSSFKTVLALT